MPTPKAKISFSVPVIIKPDNGGFHAYSPALKGLHVPGNTEEEALQNAKDAAVAYLNSLIKHGDPIPVGVVKEKRPILRRICIFRKRTYRYIDKLVIEAAGNSPSMFGASSKI